LFLNSTRKISIAASAATLLLELLFFPPRAIAQQSSVGEVKQEVPNNPSEHAPPVQPIAYSHKKHLALGLQCATCHTNPEPGNLMTFPATATCMSCHTSVAKNRPQIQKLASFAKSRQPVPWVRVYTVLPGVRWTHRKHLAAGIKCETCHGQVSEIEAMLEVTSVTTMGVCLHCHSLHNAPTTCETCHVWP
jgi:hypothetical protein